MTVENSSVSDQDVLFHELFSRVGRYDSPVNFQPCLALFVLDGGF